MKFSTDFNMNLDRDYIVDITDKEKEPDGQNLRKQSPHHRTFAG